MRIVRGRVAYFCRGRDVVGLSAPKPSHIFGKDCHRRGGFMKELRVEPCFMFRAEGLAIEPTACSGVDTSMRTFAPPGSTWEWIACLAVRRCG